MVRTAVAIAFFTGILFTSDLFAAGLLVPRNGGTPIGVRSHRVSVEIHDGLAKTTLRQTFVNSGRDTLEAIYEFPVPEGAALVDVALEAGGQRLEGLLVERRRARGIYNEIVRGRRDPALVEQIGRNTFRLSVFPVLPKKDTVVEITWVEKIPLSQGLMHYRYPLSLAQSATKTEQDFTFSAVVRSSVPIETITSPLKDMEIIRKENGDAVLSFERLRAPLDTDVEIVAEIAVSKPTMTVSTYRRAGEKSGWFTAVITPPKATEAELIPRDVILIVDTSGSMNGVKIEQARRASIYLISHLRPGDRINVVRFSTTLRPFAKVPVKADLETVARLTRFINDFRPGGGTALGDALQFGVNVPPAEGRVRTVVLLTDGLPTVGETNPEKIIGFARAGGEKGLRVFTFGVGRDVDPSLLAAISRVSRGRAEVFGPEAELEYRLRAFLDRTASPVMANIEFQTGDLRTYDVFPRPMPDGYLGEQIVITGRYDGGAERLVTATATIGGRPAQVTTKAKFRTAPGGSPAVMYLAGKEHLDYLEQALKSRLGLKDENYYRIVDRGRYSTRDEIVAEMIRVSLAHGVQCAYTSFLALLPEDRRRLDPTSLAEIRQALERARVVRNSHREQPGEYDSSGVLDGLADLGEVADELGIEESSGVKRIPGRHSGRDGGGRASGSSGGGMMGGSPRGKRAVPPTTPAPTAPAAPAPDDAPDEAESDPAAVPGPASGWIIPKFYSHRYRRSGLKKEGGTKATERAVLLALTWLANHQSPDGRWGAESFVKQCRLNQCDGPGNKLYDVGTTGLALLPFLGAGQTPFAGTHKERVLKGLIWLMAQQTEDGCFGKKTTGDNPYKYTYNHAIATRAMAEAYGLTGSPFLKASVERAVQFIHKAQNPYLAWRYGVRPADNDTSVSIWMFLALKSAKEAGIEVDQAGFDGMQAWIEKVTEPEYGRVGYTSRGTGPGRPEDMIDKFPADKSESLTAAAIIARIFLGEDPRKSEIIAKGEDLLLKCLPVWDEQSGSIDMYYWHFGTLAMMQVGGDGWGTWQTAMFADALDHQRKQGDEKGSWDPVGPWGAEGGRIYSTALMAVILESPYFYPRQFKRSGRGGGRRHRVR